MALPVIVQKPSKATLRSNTSDCTDAAEGSVEKFAYKVTNGSSDFMIKLYFTLGIVSILLALVGMTIGLAIRADNSSQSAATNYTGHSISRRGDFGSYQVTGTLTVTVTAAAACMETSTPVVVATTPVTPVSAVIVPTSASVELPALLTTTAVEASSTSGLSKATPTAEVGSSTLSSSAPASTSLSSTRTVHLSLASSTTPLPSTVTSVMPASSISKSDGSMVNLSWAGLMGLVLFILV